MSDQLIADRYRLDRRIGSGGMGEVWRATDLELGRLVALKKSHAGDDGQIRREARIGAGLQHPHVVAVHDVVRDGEDRWLVMEYLPSRSLAAVLAEDGPLAPAEAARIGAQVADALAAMHERGMVHRDIKPANILVADSGLAKLTDFGITRWAEVTQTSSGQLGGTPGYLAPEVANGAEAAAPADVFSLGATLFAAVEGTSPWGDSAQGPFAQLRRAAESDREPANRAGPLAPALSALLATRPEDRPTAAVARRLLAEATGEELTPTTPLPRPKRRWRKPVLLAGAIVLALALVAGVSVYLARIPEAEARGAIGDARTADPCALVDSQALAQFDRNSVIDFEYGDFHQCTVLARMGYDDKDILAVSLMLMGPPENPSQPHTPGQLGPPVRAPEKDGRCWRYLRTTDGNEIHILATHHDGKRSGLLCAAAESVLISAMAKLFEGPVPRRQQPFAANSLGNLRACPLLQAPELAKALGEPASKEETDFGDWICYWQDHRIEADIRLTRDHQTGPGEGEREIRIGDRIAYIEEEVNPDEGRENNCEVDIVHRRYPARSGYAVNWEEVVRLGVSAKNNIGIPMSQLCDKATELANAIVPRLPKP